MCKNEIFEGCPSELKYYDLAQKEKMKNQNYMMYLQGMYNTRAVMTAIDKCFNGRKSTTEYFDEPLQIFPLTEEEKKKKEEKSLQAFINFANGMISSDKK